MDYPNVLLFGNKNSGKTTQAKEIQKHFPEYTKVSLADPLRMMVAEFIAAQIRYQVEDINLLVSAEQVYDYLYTEPNYSALKKQPKIPLSDIVVAYSKQGQELPADLDIDYPMGLRKLLEVMGTDCVRNTLGENTWVSGLYNQVHNRSLAPIVIDDGRFRNEITYLRNKWGSNLCVVFFDYPYSDDPTAESEQCQYHFAAGHYEYLYDTVVHACSDKHTITKQITSAIWRKNCGKGYR